jgi:hypothetical protein
VFRVRLTASHELAAVAPEGRAIGDDTLTAEDRLHPSPPDATSPALPPEARPLSDPRAALIDVMVLLLLLAAVIVVVADIRAARPALIIAAATVVPGWAVLSRLAATDLLTSVALAVAFSLAIETAGSVVLGWTHWWHPGPLAAVLAGASAGVLALRVARVARGHPSAVRLPSGSGPKALRTLLTLVPLLISMGLWRLSLSDIHLKSLGPGGLAAVLPLLWYLALGLLIAGAAYACWGRRANGWVMAAYVVGAVVILYATLPALTTVPNGVWVYRHIGVTRFIVANGGPNPGGDIYNKFPAFFTLAAWLSSVMHADVISWAAWAEPFFGVLEALVVAALAFAVKPDRRVAAFTALLFTLGNWVNQLYFAPQPYAFVLSVAMLILIIRGLPAFELRPTVGAVLAFVTRRVQRPLPRPIPLGWGIRIVVAGVLVLQAALVVSHQLTPAMIVLQVGVLMVLGVVRAWWLLVAMTVLAVGYLIPYIGFLQSHYGALTTPDPFSNFLASGSDDLSGWGSPMLGALGDSNLAVLGHGVTHASFLEGSAGRFLSDLTIVLMLVAAWRVARRGGGRRALVLVLLAAAPVGALFATAYGGEATQRIFLFSSPWRDVLVALGIVTFRARRWRLLAALGTSAAVVTLCVAVFYSNTELTQLPRSEVLASEYFEAHAPRASVLMLAGPDFPTALGARYPLMVGQIQQAPRRVNEQPFWGRQLGAADIPSVIAQIRGYSSSGFLVFAPSEYRFVNIHELAPFGALGRLEAAIASSPYFRLWYRNGGTTIYKLIAVPRVNAAGRPIGGVVPLSPSG